jgi:amino acid adenylation domain-containing protein
LQLVHHSVEVLLQVEDLRHLSPAEQEATLDAWIEAEKNRPFDWTRPPLIRFQVHHRTEETFQLTLSFHHAILDGWSVASMLTELCEYLLLSREDEGSQASSIVIAFRDFVALERNAIASEECQHYWAQKLTDSTVTMLPRWRTLHQATNLQQSSRRKNVPLSSEVSEGLKQLAKLANIPLKSVLLAAHLRVLSVLSNQSDVLTGLVSNGRPEDSDGEQILGLFLNTLPFRLNLSESTWIDLARETFQAECELLPFRRYPLAEIQRHSGGQPLFDTAFNFIHFHVYRDVLGRGDIQVLDGTFFEETNLTLLANFSVDPSSSLIYLSLNCQVDALCDEQIEAIGGYYARTLAAMVNQPFGQFADHSLLSTRERQQLLVEWNKTEADFPQYQCLHQLFEAQVERTPDQVAVVFEDKQLTYWELNQRANQLARHLQKLGVKSEVLVGICVERSLEMLIGILSILKAGGAYIPLDPAYPQERLAFMLEDAQVSVLLTQQRLLERLPEHRAEIVCLDAGEIIQANDCSLIENSPLQPPLPRGEYQEKHLSLGDTEQSVKTHNPSNLAYVIYTSGSTGKPKGVQISHRALVNFLCSMRQTPGLTEQDVLLAVTTLSFDIAGLELYLPLIVGASVVIASREVAADGIRLSELLTHSSATVMQATPATWRLLLAAGWQGKKRLKILCGGEALSRELANQLLTRCDSLWNLYGPTETTIWSTIHQVKSEDRLVPIGHAIANTQVYILDHRLQPTPVGVPGELYIGGAGVARGYLNRPELTAERFISNPFSDQPEARLYKTGDLARYLPNGDIEYLGRIDYQVKIRGFRIELGEIETALAQYPGVEQAVVLAREDNPGLQRLVAYVVPDEQVTHPKSSELRDFLKKQLPDYMVPSAFVLLSALPLTPNGKVDRRALPAPDATMLAGETVYVAPRTPVEGVLTNLWVEVLNLERVGIHNNFFELGGHSLLATQLISRIRDTFQVELPLRCLFESPTIAELSDRIQATRQTESERHAPPLYPFRVLGRYPYPLLKHGCGSLIASLPVTMLTIFLLPCA